MNPYAPMFQAPIPAGAASTAARQQHLQQSGYDEDDSNHNGLVAGEDQEHWVEGAEHGEDDLDGGGGVAYWDAHGQQHLQHHHGFAGGGYGQYEAGAYHPADGYDYHQVYHVCCIYRYDRYHERIISGF